MFWEIIATRCTEANHLARRKKLNWGIGWARRIVPIWDVRTENFGSGIYVKGWVKVGQTFLHTTSSEQTFYCITLSNWLGFFLIEAPGLCWCFGASNTMAAIMNNGKLDLSAGAEPQTRKFLVTVNASSSMKFAAIKASASDRTALNRTPASTAPLSCS